MMEFTTEEIIELKHSINSLIAQRITYSISVKEGSEREANNDKYLKLDYQLLEKVLKEIDTKKAGQE